MRDNHKPAAPDPERDARREAFMDSFLGRTQPADTAPPSAPVGVDGLPQPFGYIEPRPDLSGYEVFDDPGPRRAAIWNMHGVQQALAQQPAAVDEAMVEVRKLARAMRMRSLDGATRSALLYADDLREYADRLLALATQHQEPPHV